jgi:hypothetical protein
MVKLMDERTAVVERAVRQDPNAELLARVPPLFPNIERKKSRSNDPKDITTPQEARKLTEEFIRKNYSQEYADAYIAQVKKLDDQGIGMFWDAVKSGGDRYKNEDDIRRGRMESFDFWMDASTKSAQHRPDRSFNDAAKIMIKRYNEVVDEVIRKQDIEDNAVNRSEVGYHLRKTPGMKEYLIRAGAEERWEDVGDQGDGNNTNAFLLAAVDMILRSNAEKAEKKRAEEEGIERQTRDLRAAETTKRIADATSSAEFAENLGLEDESLVDVAKSSEFQALLRSHPNINPDSVLALATVMMVAERRGYQPDPKKKDEKDRRTRREDDEVSMAA